MTGAHILATDYVLPDGVVTNADLEARNPNWRLRDVEKRTGVLERRWAPADQTAFDLGVLACERLFERTGIDRANVDAILFCTQSPDYVMPPNACMLQHSLGISSGAAAFDYSLACSGFVYGLMLANSMIVSGAATNVLLVTAETYSKLFNPQDRGPATLFGDGAAATIVSAGRSGMNAFVVGTDGSGARCFYVPAGGARSPRTSDGAARDPFGNLRSPRDIHMEGAEVLSFLKREARPMAEGVFRRSGLAMKDIDLVLVHQASRLALDYVYETLDVPSDKRFDNLADVGNTVSASLPILMRDAEITGRLKPGMRLLTLSFGVGWSWAGCVITW